MIDRRAVLPLDACGGGAGLPCARRYPRDPDANFHRVEPRKLKDYPNRERTAFAGTTNLPWMMARARSAGSLTEGGALHKVLQLRGETDFEALVKVMVKALPDSKSPNLRAFRQPHNAHRDLTSNIVSEESRRKSILRVLLKYPLVDVYDLARCPQDQWTEISRDLGGLSHGHVMKGALEYIQTQMAPVDRAAWWAAVGRRQQSCDKGKSTFFPGDRGFDESFRQTL